MQKPKIGGLLQKRTQTVFTELDARSSKHNAGIDLLRIVSMFMVVSLHMINEHWIGSQALQGKTTAPIAACLFIRAFSFCAVDIFALISGYVAYSDDKKPVRLTNYLQLWAQVVFYGLLVPAVLLIVRPQMITFKDFLFPLFPITGDMYWYFSAYTGLFFLMPLLNAALRHTPKQTLCVVLGVILALFCVYDTFLPRFELNDGYSFVWLVLLYIVGGILKKCDVGKNIKPWAAFTGAIVLSLFGWAWRAFGPEFSLRVVNINRMTFHNYTAPPVVGAAILYLIAFSKLRFDRRMKRLIAYASPCAFAVYLLNTHPIVFNRILDHCFIYLKTSSPLMIFGTVLAFSFIFLVSAILIDRLRMRFFSLLNLPSAFAWVERTARRLIRQMVSPD